MGAIYRAISWKCEFLGDLFIFVTNMGGWDKVQSHKRTWKTQKIDLEDKFSYHLSVLMSNCGDATNLDPNQL